ncbi:MAG: glycerol-3-phosphate responsive antiterminator [Bacillota bacterium]
MFDQKIIPAISNYKNFKDFLDSKLTYGILMNFQLAQLNRLVETMKKNHKKILIHSELIKGLSSDEYGAIYLIQSLNVDGIISSKPKVIEICNKRNVIGIYRFFIKDSISLEQSISIGQRLRPQFIEILPAACLELIPEIKANLNCEVLMGGLIKNKDHVLKCLNQGAIAITTSKTTLWEIDI